jgi:CheY-like chemotaxis protein
MTAAELISKNVATGLAYERLSDVAFRIATTRSHYCVVLSDDGLTCIGVVRLAEVAAKSNPGNRILGDLVGKISPMIVRSAEPAAGVATLFVRHGLSEAIAVDSKNHYVGLITSESVLAWSVKELQLNANAPEPISEPILPSPMATRQIPRSAAQPPGSRRLILVVEDHADSRSALTLILRRRDYDVIESDSVQEAQSLVRKHKFDLVISDIELPDGSGFGLMKVLREQHGLKGIALTGIPLGEDRTRSQSAGFSFLFRKPVNTRDLELAIVAVLAEQSGVIPASTDER